MSRNRKLSILMPLMFGVYFAFSQSQEATDLLDHTIEKLQSDQGYRGDFTLKMYYGSELEHEETGHIRALGDQIELDLDSYQYISDGTYSWTYLKDRNEVQINDISDDDFSMYNPLVLLNHFFEGGYDYEITDRVVTGEYELTKLEMKPKDRESGYAKIAIVIDDRSGLPHSFILVEKDGTRYEIEVNGLQSGPFSDQAPFTFDPSHYPDIIIEDLRL